MTMCCKLNRTRREVGFLPAISAPLSLRQVILRSEDRVDTFGHCGLSLIEDSSKNHGTYYLYEIYIMISKACLGAGRIDLSRTSSYQSYLGISNQHIESNQTKSCPTILGHIYSDLVISIIISLHSYLQKTYFRTAYDAIAYILSGVWIFVEAGHHKQTNKQTNRARITPAGVQSMQCLKVSWKMVSCATGNTTVACL